MNIHENRGVNMGESHIDGEGLCILTIGLDEEAARSAQQVAQRENIKLVSSLPDYPEGPFNGQLMRDLDGSDAFVCLIDFDKRKDLAVQTAVAIHNLGNGRNTLMALSADENPELILEAMRAGCSEYLRKPVNSEALSICLRKLRARWMAASLRSTSASGKVLAFLGVGGGAGATTIAVHLGTFLARCQHQKTLIVDQHPCLGHVAMLLGMDAHSYNFHDLLGNITRLDLALLKGYVAHHASGLDVIPSSDSLEPKPPVPADEIRRAIRFLADVYSFVLLDCPLDLEVLNRVIGSCCDEFYFVATPELPALRDLARCLEKTLEYGVPASKLKVVINQQGSHRTVTAEQIEHAIGHPVALVLPKSEAELIRAVDTGEPISSDRKSGFANQIKRWAATLAPVQETQIETKRRFAFWSRQEPRTSES